MALREEFRLQGDFLFRYRSYLPIIIVIAGIYAYVQKESSGGFTGENHRQLYELACFSICIAGFLIRKFTIGFADERTSGRNTYEGQVAQSLNTAGIYSLCRHPLYVGNFLIWLGLAAFTQNIWFIAAFIFLFWVYYERIMYAEEEFLISKFGDDYLDYSKSVPAFIPNFANYKKPRNKFDFRKVIKQEKSGILNLFAAIFMLRGFGQYFSGEEVIIEKYWFYGLIFAMIWYLVIKFLQKYTDVFAGTR